MHAIVYECRIYSLKIQKEFRECEIKLNTPAIAVGILYFAVK